MGLLEDAIKEHLELKRSRGADADEVEQQASEALGPVNRSQLDDAEAGEPIEPMETVAVQDHPLPAEDALHDDALSTELPPPDAAVEPPAPPPEPPAPDPPDTAAQPADPDATQAHPPPEPAADPDATQPHPAVEVASDDVLEETPEFLQETPEHDRLWFEQRPPRDFDFDK